MGREEFMMRGNLGGNMEERWIIIGDGNEG